MKKVGTTIIADNKEGYLQNPAVSLQNMREGQELLAVLQEEDSLLALRYQREAGLARRMFWFDNQWRIVEERTGRPIAESTDFSTAFRLLRD